MTKIKHTSNKSKSYTPVIDTIHFKWLELMESMPVVYFYSIYSGEYVNGFSGDFKKSPFARTYQPILYYINLTKVLYENYTKNNISPDNLFTYVSLCHSNDTVVSVPDKQCRLGFGFYMQ